VAGPFDARRRGDAGRLLNCVRHGS
jgi:hypothetical protein